MNYLQEDCAGCLLGRIVGLVLGDLGQPFLPCMFCVFKHHLGVFLLHTHNMRALHGRKEFSALQDRTKTGEQREGKVYLSPRGDEWHILTPGWCAFHPAERKPQSLSEPGSCMKFSAHC